MARKNAIAESEWASEVDPQRLLARLRGLPQGATDRGLKFFALHCCRLAWPVIVDDRSRRAVEVLERSLIGAATDEEVAGVTRAAAAVNDEADARLWNFVEEISREEFAQALGAGMVARAVGGYSLGAVNQLREALGWHGTVDADALGAELARALRDIFGYPFHPVRFSPAWRTSTVVALAAQMYGAGNFSAIPILADALQDAGCDRADVLDHCRGDGPHVRGCWVVDGVLGKE